MITEQFEKYMDKRLEENKKNRMKSKECIEILQSMSVGMSRTEKEAIVYAIKKIKKAKKWKRKYLELKGEPNKETLNGVFLKLSELGIQDMVCAEEVYRLIFITYEIGFNTGFNEGRANDNT